MADDGRWCPFGDEPHQRHPDHEHPYAPGPFCYRRCTCGSRDWEVAIHRVGGPTVRCAKCKRENFGGTAYETGRYDGRRTPKTPDKGIPF